MNRARSFFYVCLGVLALALAYHLGASTATAQAPGNAVVAAIQYDVNSVVTANGDVYERRNIGGSTLWRWDSNVFTGGPTPTARESMGQLKVRYR